MVPSSSSPPPHRSSPSPSSSFPPHRPISPSPSPSAFSSPSSNPISTSKTSPLSPISPSTSRSLCKSYLSSHSHSILNVFDSLTLYYHQQNMEYYKAYKINGRCNDKWRAMVEGIVNDIGHFKNQMGEKRNNKKSRSNNNDFDLDVSELLPPPLNSLSNYNSNGKKEEYCDSFDDFCAFLDDIKHRLVDSLQNISLSSQTPQPPPLSSSSSSSAQPSFSSASSSFHSVPSSSSSLPRVPSSHQSPSPSLSPSSSHFPSVSLHHPLPLPFPLPLPPSRVSQFSSPHPAFASSRHDKIYDLNETESDVEIVKINVGKEKEKVKETKGKERGKMSEEERKRKISSISSGKHKDSIPPYSSLSSCPSPLTRIDDFAPPASSSIHYSHSNKENFHDPKNQNGNENMVNFVQIPTVPILQFNGKKIKVMSLKDRSQSYPSSSPPPPYISPKLITSTSSPISPIIPYINTEKNQSTREGFAASSCDECNKFYKLAGDPNAMIECSHQQKSKPSSDPSSTSVPPFSNNNNISHVANPNSLADTVGRHRHEFAIPLSPEGFWDISTPPDTALYTMSQEFGKGSGGEKEQKERENWNQRKRDGRRKGNIIMESYGGNGEKNHHHGNFNSNDNVTGERIDPNPNYEKEKQKETDISIALQRTKTLMQRGEREVDGEGKTHLNNPNENQNQNHRDSPPLCDESLCIPMLSPAEREEQPGQGQGQGHYMEMVHDDHDHDGYTHSQSQSGDSVEIIEK